MYLIELTKRLSFLVAALMVVSLFACGTTDDSDGNGGGSGTEDAGGRGRSEVGNPETDTGSGTTSDTGGTPTIDTGIITEDTGGGTTTGTAAERLCDRIIACFGELTCSQPVELDRAGCITAATGQGVTEQDAAMYEGTDCAEINRGTCGANPDLAGICDCPDAPQGDCPEGQFCTVGLRDQSGNVSYACGTEGGEFPPGAATCSQEAPCAGATEICVVTEVGATTGTCLGECTP